MFFFLRSWTSPDLSLVDRVLLILFDQTEESGWKHLSSVADFSRVCFNRLNLFLSFFNHYRKDMELQHTFSIIPTKSLKFILIKEFVIFRIAELSKLKKFNLF